MTRRQCLLAVAAAIAIAWLALAISRPQAPPFAGVRAGYRPSDAVLLDRNGAILHELRVDPKGRRLEWTPLSAVSQSLVSAVLASEDRRFHEHGGVDVRAIGSAALEGLRTGRLRGASTITMQLASLLEGRRRARSFSGKWRQMRAAWALERAWTKAEILEAYLNLVTFRGEVEGVSAAAAVLAGKEPHGLTAPESAVLAALVRAPNADRAVVARRAAALAGQLGGVAASDLETALDSVLSRSEASAGPRIALASHAARRLLGRSSTAVRSTLDAAAQRTAVESLRAQILAVRDRRVADGAVLAVDNRSGEVLAYVGSSEALSRSRFVDGVQAPRQAGSALKPFLYELAFERRLLTPASLLEDTPLEVAVGGGLYRPENYDQQFRGLVSVRTALASSLNVPAVRAAGIVGVDAFASELRRLGFRRVVESGDYYGPSLALGSVEVSLWEIVAAYRSLANGGMWSPLRMRAGEPAAEPSRVASAAAAFLVSTILSDRESRTATFGLESALATRFWSAVKTGTSKDMRDNWCVGYSRRFTVGVWVGNFSGEPMRDVTGVTGAAPIWVEVMSALEERGRADAAPEPPTGVVSAAVAFPRSVEPGRDEWFSKGTEPLDGEVSAVGTLPRIVRPTSGTIFTIDPDMPPLRQRIVFEAEAGDGLRWQLDGRELGRAGRPALWRPSAGRHQLSIVDASGSERDGVTFDVRDSLPRQLSVTR